MSSSPDLVVIGAGTAGRFAALAAAEAGCSVRIVSDGEDTSRLDTGLLDLLGRVDPDSAVVDPFDALERLDDGHPYRVVETDTVRAALAYAERVLGDRYRGFDDDRNAMVLSQQGHPIPAFAYPESVTPGLVSAPGDIHLVDVSFLPDLDAAITARTIRQYEPPFDVSTSRIGMDVPQDLPNGRLSLASRLDHEVTAPPSERTVLPWLVDGIDTDGIQADRIGLPAFLGRERTGEVIEHLETRLGVPIFEIPTAPPSLIGIRLDDRLDEAILESGVEATSGTPVVDYRRSRDRVEAVALERAHTREWIEGAHVVLATGGLLGGGLAERDGAIEESVFECPVDTPTDRGAWSTADPYAPQPFAQFGIDVDDEFRPRDGTGACFENLRAAGSVLGGFDATAQRARTGSAVVTGYAVGRRIAEVVGRA